MTTPPPLEASRSARRATGPRSARGKRRASRNATRHGLRCASPRLTPAEKGRLYRKMAAYLAMFREPDELTRRVAYRAAHALVMLRRVELAQATHPDGPESLAAMDLWVRHAPGFQRTFLNAVGILTAVRPSGRLNVRGAPIRLRRLIDSVLPGATT